MNADNQAPWWRSDAAKISIVGVLAAGVISFFTPAVQSWFSLGGSVTASGSRSAVSSTLTPGVSVSSSSSVLTTENAAAGPPSAPTNNTANNNVGAVGPGVGAAGVAPQQTTPTSEYLSDLDPIEGDNRIKVATLENNGVQTTYAHSLRTQAEHDASPNAATMGSSNANQIVVTLSPPVRRRAVESSRMDDVGQMASCSAGGTACNGVADTRFSGNDRLRMMSICTHCRTSSISIQTMMSVAA